MLIDKVQPKFVETVEIGTGVLPIEVTREDWTKFIAEVREGKHDWPSGKPERKPILIQVDGMTKSVWPGDDLFVSGPYDKIIQIKVIG